LRIGCGIQGPVPFSPWIRDRKGRIWDPGYKHTESGTLFVRLREELEGVPVSRQKMKLVSLFMEEIQELVDDPAKARYKPIIAEFGLNVIHSWYNFKGNLCNDFLISYRLSFYVAEAVR
jgi:hypothetical protein